MPTTASWSGATSSHRSAEAPGRPAPSGQGIKWPQLIEGSLIRSYKRFLADVKLGNGHAPEASLHLGNDPHALEHGGGQHPRAEEELRRVMALGVEALAYDVDLDIEWVRLRRAVPFLE
ncbi:MAG: hypothetical protein R6V25_03130 [Desulfatiglandales bacterium]